MPEPIDLYDRSLYINRELSWLEFNRRCLDEAGDPSTPLLERVKFLAIAYGNMDEFFMIRMPGIHSGPPVHGPAHIEPDAYEDHEALIADLDAKVLSLVTGYDSCWTRLSRDLADRGIRILSADALDDTQRAWADGYYRERIHDLLTPLALDVTTPFPFISNNSLNLAVRIGRDGGEFFARLKVPTGMLPRFVKLPSAAPGMDFVLLEDIIRMNAGDLFPDSEVLDTYKFRVTRNADIKVTIDEACDLMSAVETSLGSRSKGFPVRIMVEEDMPGELLALFVQIARIGENREAGAGVERSRRAVRIERFRAMVDRHFSEHLPVEHYAAALGVSAGQLARLCRESLGMSPLDVINARLMHEAQRELVYSTLAVKQIAGFLGFEDEAYFGRFFKKHAGRTPTAFRELARRQLADER